MSFIVKGVDIPKACWECPQELSDAANCRQWEEYDGFYEDRHPKCPLVQIPKNHGNVIDRDELIEHLKKDPLFSLVENYGITGVIKSRPVILEEEEES